MAINQKIFKSYDIRGVYPAELNEEAAYLIGRAFARKTKAKKVAVGSDMRLSGPALKAKLIEGITDEGVDVADIGLVTIDTVYVAVGILKYAGGIMVTASHNPKEYNGFKMILAKTKWLRGEALLNDVLKLPKKIAKTKGKVEAVDILPDYIKHVLSFCNPKKIKNLKVIIDAGNGMAGKITPLLEPHLPIKVIPLNFKLDGSFPVHPSNPLLPESQIQITREVVRQKADFGVIFDGDTDRLFFVDEKGKFIRADITLLLLAKEFLRREPGASIAYNLICSKIVPEKIKEWGGKPIRTKVGFVNVSDGLKKNQGIMGGELAAHYCFRDNAYSDSGFIPLVILLELLSRQNQPLSEIVKPFYKYAKAPEENLVFENRQTIDRVIAEFKKQYRDGKQDFLDGLTVEYNDWWFNARASNTEPLLRVTVEADTEEKLLSKKRELVDFVNKIK
ncbi:MAG: phosphomannomutase/phosphoglucomutase [Patescibacteria group bacterium]|jgi:phosphomannomutase